MRTLAVFFSMLVITAQAIAWTQSLAEPQGTQKQPPLDLSRGGRSNPALEADEPGSLTLASGTEIEVEMLTRIDLKNVKPGDPFTLKTMKPVKREAKTLIAKGSMITGVVDEIATAETETRLTLLLEDVKDAESGMPSSIQAKIVKVIRNAPPQPDPEIMDVAPGQQSRSSAPQPQGGTPPAVNQPVTGTPDQAATAAGSATRSAASASTGTTKSSDAAAPPTLRVIADPPPPDPSALPLPGSILSLTGGNTRIEVGTTFLLKTTADSAIAVKPTRSLN